jgi:hypothetical protein
MSLTEHQNVELISNLIEKSKVLESELDLKMKENESLLKNLEILQSNFEERKLSFQKDMNQYIRTSDLEKEKDLIEKMKLEERVEDLNKEIGQLKVKLENM